MILLWLILLAFGPSLVWLYWLWSRDKFHREPVALMARLVAGGGLLAVPLVLLAVPLYERYIPAQQTAPTLHMLLVAGLPEEIAKMLPVLLFAWRSPQWDEPFDGIVYGGATALGFHLVETGISMFTAAGHSLAATVYQGMVRGFKPGHMLYGVAMGYFLSRARFSGSIWGRIRYFLLALIVPVALHTAWDSTSAYGGVLVGGETVGEIFFSLVAWGLSVALWVIAFQYMKEDEDTSPYNPEALSAPLAPEPCPACGGAYPEGARYCHACGTRLEPLHQVTGSAE